VNEKFDLSSTQSLSYQFPLWLDWVGSHTRIRIQGGVVTGRIPTSLDIKIILDKILSQQTFSAMNGLQKQYTFHSTSEYILEVPSPARPALEGIRTLHNLTVELNFLFSATPEGLGLLHQIVFETFSLPPLKVSDSQPIVLLQDQFSWEIKLWSFGRFFFNTSLLIPLFEPRNVSLLTVVEFSGLTLDSWQISIEQGEQELQVHDSLTLDGIIELHPTNPCELRLIVDPPQVSESQIVSVKIKVRGTILPPPEHPSSNNHIADSTSQKRLTEGILLIQLGIVVVPILMFYRIRRPFLKKSFKEEDR
ncbi:MAG: hypothetical protein ACFFBD_12600, partial [Candidatus Hodarchaeota archaeon]